MPNKKKKKGRGKKIIHRIMYIELNRYAVDT